LIFRQIHQLDSLPVNLGACGHLAVAVRCTHNRKPVLGRLAGITGSRTTLATRLTHRMDIKRGIAVSPGVAIGPALVLDTEGFRIPHRLVETTEHEVEVARLRSALAAAAREAHTSGE